LLGDDPETLSAALVSVIQNSRLRGSLEETGRSYVERNHQWQQSAEILHAVYREAQADGPQGSR
jgi:hypothetical protein